MIQALRHESSESLVCASQRTGMVTEYVGLFRRLSKKYADKIELLSLNCETLFYTLNSNNSPIFFPLKLHENIDAGMVGIIPSPYPGVGCSIHSPGVA